MGDLGSNLNIVETKVKTWTNTLETTKTDLQNLATELHENKVGSSVDKMYFQLLFQLPCISADIFTYLFESS